MRRDKISFIFLIVSPNGQMKEFYIDHGIESILELKVVNFQSVSNYRGKFFHSKETIKI